MTDEEIYGDKGVSDESEFGFGNTSSAIKP